jgi:hypothetical protein
LVLLKSSYHHPRIHTLDDTLESSRFLNYYTRTRAYVEEHSSAGVSDASTHRQLKADCHWDARKLKTVCIQADGSTWVGPAGDKTERRDGATAEPAKGKAIREPKLESPAAAARAAARAAGGNSRKPKNEEEVGADEGEGGGETEEEEGGGSDDDESVSGSTNQRTGKSGSLPPLKGRKQRLKQGEPLECGAKKPAEHGPLLGGGASGLKPFGGSSRGKASAVNSVILFVVDDLQPDGVSSFGVRPRPSSERKAYKFMRTLKLDELAQGGAIFARAYTPHPLCSPSRYAILTGRYASRSRRLNEMAVHRSKVGGYGSGLKENTAHVFFKGNFTS